MSSPGLVRPAYRLHGCSALFSKRRAVIPQRAPAIWPTSRISPKTLFVTACEKRSRRSPIGLRWCPRLAEYFDVGCGAGTWTKIFADRYDSVVGIEQSPSMVVAAQTLLAPCPGAKVVEGDIREDLPEGPFDLIFLGGLCMYLNDLDVVAILRSLKDRLASGASIVLRESTVPQGKVTARGDYQAVYRNVSLYQDLFREAGFPDVRISPQLRIHEHGSRSGVGGDTAKVPTLLAGAVPIPWGLLPGIR